MAESKPVEERPSRAWAKSFIKAALGRSTHPDWSAPHATTPISYVNIDKWNAGLPPRLVVSRRQGQVSLQRDFHRLPDAAPPGSSRRRPAGRRAHEGVGGWRGRRASKAGTDVTGQRRGQEGAERSRLKSLRSYRTILRGSEHADGSTGRRVVILGQEIRTTTRRRCATSILAPTRTAVGQRHG